MTLQEELETYRNKNKVTTKGKLSAILYVSRLAVTNGLPLDSSVLVTDSKGQVKGLGKSSVQRILNDHDVTRVLAEEGGRTSRGSLGNIFCSACGRPLKTLRASPLPPTPRSA